MREGPTKRVISQPKNIDENYMQLESKLKGQSKGEIERERARKEREDLFYPPKYYYYCCFFYYFLLLLMGCVVIIRLSGPRKEVRNQSNTHTHT